MNFGMITLKQSTKTKQNYAMWIQTALLFILKLKIFIKALLVMLKNNTSNYSENDKRLVPVGKNKNVISLFKDQLVGKNMKEFVGIRLKTWAYLMDDDTEHKKAKGTKKI